MLAQNQLTTVVLHSPARQNKMASDPIIHKEQNQTQGQKASDNQAKRSTIDVNASKIAQNKNILDSELVYTRLIEEEKADHTIYGNLGAIRGMQGRHDELIELTQKALTLKPNHYIYLNNLGNAKKEKGDIDEATHYYKKAIEINPKFTEAHNNLGTLLQEQGLFEEAIISYNKAIELREDYATAYNNLGVSLKEIGCLREAIEAHTKAINLKPEFAEAHYNLANSFAEKDEKEKALDSYVKTLQLNPNHAKALVGAGNIFFAQGENEAAISSYRKAIELDSNLISAHNNLGGALEELNSHEKALESFMISLKLNPRDARAHLGLSTNLMQTGNIEQAIKHAKIAIDIEPTNSSHYCALSKCERARGKFNESRSALHKALKINPCNTNALHLLSMQAIDKSDAERLLELTENINIQSLSNKQLSMLEFAKANCLHKSKNYAQASLHLAKANKLKLSYLPSDLSEWHEKNQKNHNNSHLFEDAHPHDGSNRIFIVGVPRCGSTLLESILATNPCLKDLGETNALTKAIYSISENTNKEKKYNLCKLYDEQVAITVPGNYSRTIDKNLYNFINVRHIASSMPSAKIIHCNRHPLDNILSMLRAELVLGNNYTSDPADAAKMIVMQEQTLRRAKADYPDQIFSINYDSLVNTPEQSIKTLIAWLGLTWSEYYLHPEHLERIILTASVVQARKPINNKSVGGWKNYRNLLEPASQILRDSNLFDSAIF